jgi:hypothetical protein
LLLSALDEIACQWPRLENSGPPILLVYSADQLYELVTLENPATQEFGLIMLRLALVDEVPDGAIPFLAFLFADYFENAPFLARRHVAKIFLEALPYMGLQMCEMIVPIGIGDKIHGCVDGHLSETEFICHGDGLALLDEFFLDEDTDDPGIESSDGDEQLDFPGSPVFLEDESVTPTPVNPESELSGASSAGSSTEALPAVEPPLPVLSGWDQLAPQWATLANTGPFLQGIWSIEQLNDLAIYEDPDPSRRVATGRDGE